MATDIPLPCTSDRLTDSIAPPGSVVDSGNGKLQLAVQNGRLWPDGKQLRVRFVDPISPKLEKSIKDLVRQYEQITSLNFKWLPRGSTEPAEIKVAFNPKGGYESFIGRDCVEAEQVKRGAPTMNLAVNDNTSKEDLSRYVLHEFGHAIGCVHEHQSPASRKLQWNVDYVNKAYKKSDNWEPEKVMHNVMKRYGDQDTTNSEYDPDSIMLYQFPKEFFTNGQPTKLNNKLSKGDIAFLKKVYPKVGKRAPGKWDYAPGRAPKPKTSKAALPATTTEKLTMDVEFGKPYLHPPSIAVGITALDLSKTQYSFQAEADSVTEEGFTLRNTVGQEAELSFASVDWIEADAGDVDMQAGSATVNKNTTKDGGGLTYKTVHFPRRFLSPPKVMLWVSGFDVSSRKGLEPSSSGSTFALNYSFTIKTTAENITTGSFDWGFDTSQYNFDELTVSWVAYSPDMEGVASGIQQTVVAPMSNVNPRFQTGRIKFPDDTFDDPPRVFLALSSCRTSPGAPIQFIMEASDVTETDFEWNIESWDKSMHLGQIAFSWIAFA